MPRKARAASTPSKTRKHRARPVPKWLLANEALDQIAQRRCLMMLSVLSGEKPVTDAIAEAGITRPLYYLLERRAILAMLEALKPGADANGEVPTSEGRIRDLEEKTTRLEREKRRAERLLFLTRKVLKPGPMKMRGPGRPPKSTNIPSSTKTGTRRSRKSKTASTSTPATTTSTNSIPTTAGAAEP